MCGLCLSTTYLGRTMCTGCVIHVQNSSQYCSRIGYPRKNLVVWEKFWPTLIGTRYYWIFGIYRVPLDSTRTVVHICTLIGALFHDIQIYYLIWVQRHTLCDVFTRCFHQIYKYNTIHITLYRSYGVMNLPDCGCYEVSIITFSGTMHTNTLYIRVSVHCAYTMSGTI